MTFDAHDVASEAIERGDDPLEAVVTQLAGFASVCWDEQPAGVFDDQCAGAAVASTIAWLRRQVVTHMEPGERLALFLRDDAMEPADLQGIRDWVSGVNPAPVLAVVGVTGAVVVPPAAPVEGVR